MAPTLEAGKVEELALSVQEMSLNGNILPQNYLLKETLVSAADLPVLDLETIDIGLLNSSSPEGEQEIKKLRAALESSGYFQAVNHGMTPSFLEEAHAVTRRFFLLPEEEKMKYARSSDGFDGYGNDPAYSNQTLDWNDRLYLNVLPEFLRKFEKCSKNPDNFSNILKEFTEKLRIMNEVILKAMAKSLNLEEDCFINMYGENPGDQLEIMSNGIFKSPVHRVATNEKKERITVAIFFTPDHKAEVKPADGLINEDNPRLYKSVVDYTSDYFKSFQLGRRPIEALKI